MAFCENITISGITNCFPENAINFKQLQHQGILELPSLKPDMEHILHAQIDVEIVYSQVLRTPSAESFEGQILTGMKMLVSGKINQKVEYASDNINQSVHAAEFAAEFSTCIILDKNSNCNDTYNINYYIEDAYIKQLDNRGIFSCIALLLVAVPLNKELIWGIPGENIIAQEINKELEETNDYLESKRDYFSQISCSEINVLPIKNPDIEQIISVIADVEIATCKFINTIKGISKEGQQLAGCMAILQLRLKQKTLYAADIPDRAVFALENTAYKSAYIVLPTLIEGTSPEVLYKCKMLVPKITVEDVYYTRLNKRSIFNNISLSIQLELIPTYEICYSSYSNCTCSNIFLAYENGGNSTAITKNNAQICLKPSWSPNGNYIAYMSSLNDGYSLNCFNMKSCSNKSLIPINVFKNISSFSWLPNSRQIIFSGIKEKCKDLYLFDMESNKLEQITFGSGLIRSYYPKVSPKGGYVAYLRSAVSLVDLWCSDLEGKMPNAISDSGAVKDYDWLVNGEGFVYVDSKNEDTCEIYLFKLNDRHTSRIFKSDTMYGLKKIAVSPNGLYIAFIGINKDCDDIYLYSFGTRRVHNLTKHKTPIKINDIIWKIDSSKIYYSAKELGYYNIYSANLLTRDHQRLSNTNSSCIQLSYRPRIK